MAKKKELPGGVHVPGGLFDPQGHRAVKEKAVEAAREELPSIVEFKGSDGRLWRLEKVESFCAEFELGEVGLDLERLTSFLEALHFSLLRPENERVWLIVRRLFGIMPVTLKLKDDVSQWERWDAVRLCGELGISADKFQEEMKALRAGMRALVGREEKESENPPPGVARGSSNAPVLVETPTELLTKYGYSASMFQAQVSYRREVEDGKFKWETRPREQVENDLEMQWFCGRVKEMEKLLARSNTVQLARGQLMHELRMRRAEVDLFKYTAGTEEYEKARKDYEAAEKSHQEVLSKIAEVAPWANQNAKEVGLAGCVSDIIKGMQDWHARADKKLVDGLFTAAEIQVQLRTSVQFPKPRYRAGWVMAIVEARKSLWDPAFKSQFKESDLKKMDRGFAGAIEEVMAEDGEEPIDLLKDEYPEIGPDEKDGKDETTEDTESTESAEKRKA